MHVGQFIEFAMFLELKQMKFDLVSTPELSRPTLKNLGFRFLKKIPKT